MMATQEFTDRTLREADAAIKASQAYQQSKADARLGSIEHSISSVVNSPFASMVQSDVAAEGFALVQDQVNNFVKTSKALMSVLDEVAKAHPFIQVAVSLFKAGITLELTRRENDGKVVALNLTMCDMMQTLTLLKQVANPQRAGPGGISIEERLRQRLGSVIDSIKRCAKLCDSYQKRHTAIKFFTSPKWKGKFTEVAQTFVDHKAAIQFDLQVHASVGVTTANVTLSTMNASMSVLNENVTKIMEVVFERMRSPEERDIAAVVASQSQSADLEEMLQDDKLMERVLAKSEKEKNQRTVKGRGEPTVTVLELRKEVDKDVEQVLAENEFFDQKFEAMRVQVDEVKVTITHESDRVINTILAGPHERIIDKDLYHIWKEMGWKGSVKAKHLVMALHDHFAERSHTALAAIRDIAEDADSLGDPGTAEKAVKAIADIARRADPETLDEDEWTLQYITVLRVQPLIEALDDDVSSFVTIAEVNAFTSARPATWSLPHWIAYWTYGFEMTVQWYSRRIRKVISDFIKATYTALPANRNTISSFVATAEVKFVEDLLSGLRDVEEWRFYQFETDPVFAKFKDYVVEQEERMERNLRSIKYCVDEENTLAIVTGSGRLEKNLLPLIYLLLRRSLEVVRQGHTITLHENELQVITRSLGTVNDAVLDRLRTLQAVYKLQNLNVEDQLRKYFYGLLLYVHTPAEKRPYWYRDPDYDALLVVDDTNTKPAPEPIPLIYGAQTEDMDATDHLTPSSDASPTPATARSFVGHWSGTYTFPGTRTRQGAFAFTITQAEPSGFMCGYAADSTGPVHMYATCREGRLAMYFLGGELQDGPLSDGCTVSQWSAVCQVGMGAEEIELRNVKVEGATFVDDGSVVDGGSANGKSSTDAEIEALQVSPPTADGDDILATLIIRRRPTEYMLAYPPPAEFAQNRPRALWELAINATLAAVRARAFSWQTISERARRRERYTELRKLQSPTGNIVSTDDAREWVRLVSASSPHDLHVWYCLGAFEARREVQHSVYCNGCGLEPITSTRFVCLDCAEDEDAAPDDTIDICSTCFSAREYIPNDAPTHTPAHTMLQMRMPSWRVSLYSTFSGAKSTLESVQRAMTSTPGGLRCIECGSSVTSLPYFCCYNCNPANIVVCYECNRHIETERAWLRERARIASTDKHGWYHTLISVPLPAHFEQDDKSHSVETGLSKIEQRIKDLEGRLGVQEGEYIARLTTLERLVRELLTSR